MEQSLLCVQFELYGYIFLKGREVGKERREGAKVNRRMGKKEGMRLKASSTNSQ